MREWNVAVNQAMTVAWQSGKVPAGLDRTLEGAAEAAIDWRELLRRLWSDTIPADYSWMRPNRRHLWTGLYLPGVVRDGVGEVAIAVDCSGSVTARQLRLFEAEVRSILEGQRPQRVLRPLLRRRRPPRGHQANGLTSTPVGGTAPISAHVLNGSMSRESCRSPSSF